MFILFEVLIRLIQIYTWVLVIYALLSWFPQVQQSIFGRGIRRLVEPYLSIFNRIPTRFGLFDFKVVIGVIALLIFQRFILIVFSSFF